MNRAILLDLLDLSLWIGTIASLLSYVFTGDTEVILNAILGMQFITLIDNRRNQK